MGVPRRWSSRPNVRAPMSRAAATWLPPPRLKNGYLSRVRLRRPLRHARRAPQATAFPPKNAPRVSARLSLLRNGRPPNVRRSKRAPALLQRRRLRRRLRPPSPFQPLRLLLRRRRPPRLLRSRSPHLRPRPRRLLSQSRQRRLQRQRPPRPPRARLRPAAAARPAPISLRLTDVTIARAPPPIGQRHRLHGSRAQASINGRLARTMIVVRSVTTGLLHAPKI